MALTAAQRLTNLLKLDRKDILQVFFYAILPGCELVASARDQAIVNLIQAGRVSVSWIVLIFVVISGVALVASSRSCNSALQRTCSKRFLYARLLNLDSGSQRSKPRNCTTNIRQNWPTDF
jgi:hypothetical protein